jgi:hypothetical protein
MTNAITEMKFDEVQNVGGGVTQSPDGKGCTEHGPVLSPIGNTLQGGPASVDLSLFG